MGAPTTSPMLEAALAYAARGWPVFPVTVRPRGRLKAKAPLTTHGFKDASTDAEQIRAWWRQYPDAAIGVPTGEVTGFDLLDFDPKSGGDATLNDLEMQHGFLPETYRARSGSGGWHYLFAHHPGVGNKQGVLSGMDVRGEGGYWIAPPSGHPSGGTYQWEDGPDDVELLPWPSWALELLHVNGTAKEPAAPPATNGRTFEAGERHKYLLAKALKWADTLPLEVLHAAVMAENRARCVPPKDADEVRRVVEWAWERRAPAERKPEAPVLLRLSDVEREDVTFLWEPYVPRGKITIFQGLPEAAKTMTACWLAARISTGTVPGNPAAPANVLFLIAEDGLADTIRPRCESMGADLSRIYVLEAKRVEDKEQPVYFTDLDLLGQVLLEVQPAAMIADPIQAFLGADVDMHRANETRPVLSGLKRLADKARCAVVLVGHFRKGGGGQVMERTLGSIDIAGAARSILSFGKDPNDGDARHALHTKSNLAKAGHGLLFRWGADHVYGYAGESTMTAEILFAAPGRPPTKLHDAEDFLRELLADGPKPSAQVEEEAKRAGIAQRTLKRAREELGVLARKADFGTGWVLRLPDGGDGS